MKFTPEEMAYEPPVDVSDPKRFPTIARGRKQWEEYLSFKRGFIRLVADLRSRFKGDKEVNEVLRRLLDVVNVVGGKRKRRTVA